MLNASTNRIPPLSHPSESACINGTRLACRSIADATPDVRWIFSYLLLPWIPPHLGAAVSLLPRHITDAYP
jgi:hypothetical protein